jgi:hypothetical protein
MDTIVVLLVFCFAVLYVYRYLAASVKKVAPSCACDGCPALCGTRLCTGKKDHGLLMLESPTSQRKLPCIHTGDGENGAQRS